MMQESGSDHNETRPWNVQRIDDTGVQVLRDKVVVEEPLEIRIEYGARDRRNEIPLSVTMRTPGDDTDLARGFLLTEGIISHLRDVLSVQQVSENVVTVRLHPECVFVPGNIQRHFYTTSSCGICGKASIDMVRQVSAYRLIPGQPKVLYTALLKMGAMLTKAQPVFSETGGIHATALFNTSGELICIREDIGRHNAMDKLIGWAAVNNRLPLSDHLVLVSGRGGFELVQKALVAGIAIFAAVGAPSSLALELAEESDMTVAGFLRADRVNVYTHPERIMH